MISSAPHAAARPLAYVFYAISDTYAMAVMVFVHLLRRCGVRSDADLAVLHVGVSARTLARMRAMGLVTRAVERPARWERWWAARDELLADASRLDRSRWRWSGLLTPIVAGR